MRHEALYDVHWRMVKRAALSWLDRVQDIAKGESPAQIVIATAVLFLMVCKRFNLNEREVLTTADRVLRRAWDVDPQYPRAIQQYLREEMTD